MSVQCYAMLHVSHGQCLSHSRIRSNDLKHGSFRFPFGPPPLGHLALPCLHKARSAVILFDSCGGEFINNIARQILLGFLKAMSNCATVVFLFLVMPRLKT